MAKINEWHNNIIKEGEQVSAIPYTLLHILEEKYGSVKNVPESNRILQKIRKIIGFSTHDDSKQAIYRDDIRELINQGFTIREIAMKLAIGETTVANVTKKNHYHVKPRFRYKLINRRINAEIFVNNQKAVSKLINHKCNSLDEIRNYAAIEGYQFIINDNMFIWKDLKTGDRFILNGKMKVKQ